ncbi:MAG: hypothetical protein ACRD1H_15895 [Vicinamibacterales bacterium]
MTLNALLTQILLVLGIGFLIANLRVGLELVRWGRRRSHALITWPAKKPPYYGLSLGIGVMLGLLILLKAYLALRQANDLGQWFVVFGRTAFGELMMFVYFGYMLPLSTRITRGLYAEGIWTDTGFMPYSQIGGIKWREGEPPTLLMISRLKALARSLEVPTRFLGEVRRVLRDKISSHAIEMDEGPGLHLGARDARDSV